MSMGLIQCPTNSACSLVRRESRGRACQDVSAALVHSMSQPWPYVDLKVTDLYLDSETIWGTGGQNRENSIALAVPVGQQPMAMSRWPGLCRADWLASLTCHFMTQPSKRKEIMTITTAEVPVRGLEIQSEQCIGTV